MAPLTLQNLPADILVIIFDFVLKQRKYDAMVPSTHWISENPYPYENFDYTRPHSVRDNAKDFGPDGNRPINPIAALSLTSGFFREQTLPWVFQTIWVKQIHGSPFSDRKMRLLERPDIYKHVK